MKKSTKSTLVAFAIVLGCLASACKDENEERVKTLAPICERSTDALKGGSDLDPDTFMQYLENALKSCSAACDAKHKESCTALGNHLENLCKVTPDACDSFCESASGSLKSEACKHTKS